MGNSKLMREISAESDCLHLGMGWSFGDLERPHVMLQSAYGESHPGSSHLLTLSHSARDGVLQSGGRPATFVVTDMCDGVAQGNVGNNYSLLSRDFIAYMIEIQVVSTLVDGLVLMSSCDKSLPAHIMAAARMKLPTVIIPGGTMSAGAAFSACDQMWEKRREVESGTISQYEYDKMCAEACPTAGACQQFGTAGTMQAMAEALGLALPGSAVTPVANTALMRNAVASGEQVINLIKKGITSKDILTREAFENAVTVHAAIGGSANAIVHIIAAANEAGIDFTISDFDKIHQRTPYISNTQSTGMFPTEYFWYAGGIPSLMLEIRDLLNPKVMTVTGKTLGENLDEWEKNRTASFRRKYLKNFRIDWREVIKPSSQPIREDGGIAILKGNLAPGGAIVKHSAVLPEMQVHRGKAKVFENEVDAVKAVVNREIEQGDIIFVTGCGPKAMGMPELFRIGDAIACDPVLSKSVAVVTDGRYSGCTKGPAIGYVCPEAVNGGPVGLVRTGDIIQIDIPARKISLVEGLLDNEILSGDELIQRRTFENKYEQANGVLGLYQRLAQAALLGGNII